MTSSFVGEENHAEKCKRCIAITVKDVVTSYLLQAQRSGSLDPRSLRVPCGAGGCANYCFIEIVSSELLKFFDTFIEARILSI